MVGSELCFNLAAHLLTVTEQILWGYCLWRLMKPFMKRKETAWCVWVAYSLTMMALYAMKFNINSTTVSVGIFAALIVMGRIDRRNYEQKIFLSVAFFSMCWTACSITEILHDNLYEWTLNTEYMAMHPNRWAALYAAMCIVYLVMEIPMILAGIGYILKVYAYKSANMTKKELCMLLVPLLMAEGGLEIIHYYRGFYIRETGKNMDVYDVRAMFYYIVSIAVIVVMIGLYQSIKAKQEEHLQNELLAAQMDNIRRHIGQVEVLYQNIRGIKHDMANHILTLERLYERNRTEEAREYGSDLKAALAGAAGEIKTGNPVTDVILQEWNIEAEKKEIRFRSDFYYPTGADINAFDISVILNNALQNAVENTMRNASVHIRSYHRNHAYMIEISNSFSGSLQWDMESGLPVTSKGKTHGHGYGLSNIRRVAAKYAGDIAVDIKDGKFCLSVMLMMH